MRFTVADVARAVDKTEIYVRQHIQRGHLMAQKDGRHVHVLTNDLIRWARERGLSLELPPQTFASDWNVANRTARIVVLAWHSQGSKLENLFTFIRHRRKDMLGPWARPPDEVWNTEELGPKVRMFSCDKPLERCQSFLDGILDNGIIEIDGNEIQYDLAPVPRSFWAYRDSGLRSEDVVRSPFSRHSAKVVEYWSLSHKAQEEWHEYLDEFRSEFSRHFQRMRFPLDRRSERAGNLMIAAAEDSMTCSLSGSHNSTLKFHVDADEKTAAGGSATVWASHCDDMVLNREFALVPGPTILRVESDIDHLGFAVHRKNDGQCIDLVETVLAKGFKINMNIISGNSLQLRHPPSRFVHEVSPPGSHSVINVNVDDKIPALDRAVNQQWRYRRAWLRESLLRRERKAARFQPGEFKEAVRYFIQLLSANYDKSRPIYLADPYFMARKRGEQWTKLYLDLFAATARSHLRILCCQEEATQGWWSKYPSAITSHIRVRSFEKNRYGKSGKFKPAFHDRYLITPGKEVIITHSINGWNSDGVTFATIPYGLYRDESEWLWSLGIGQESNPILVIEIN